MNLLKTALVLVVLFIVLLLVAIAGLLLKAEPAVAAQGPVAAAVGDPMGFETISVTNSTAVGFTAATSANASKAYCTVETVAIRYRMDGTNPTSSVGLYQLSAATSNVAYSFWVNGKNAVIRFRMIATSGTASVGCHYFR